MESQVDLRKSDASETGPPGAESFEQEFDRLIREDDGSAADEILASGRPIYIARDGTPEDHIVRVHPDGREEMIAVDWSDIARLLGQ